jgi:hypothetical protein
MTKLGKDRICEYMLPAWNIPSGNDSPAYAMCGRTLYNEDCINTALDETNCPRAATKPKGLTYDGFEARRSRRILEIQKAAGGPFLYPGLPTRGEAEAKLSEIHQRFENASTTNKSLGE